MAKKYPYWIYIVGVLVVWSIVLLISWKKLSPHRFHGLIIFFGGFLFGILMASIARNVFK